MVDYGNVVMWHLKRTLKCIGVQLSLNFPSNENLQDNILL
jgi:hypothetical protein